MAPAVIAQAAVFTIADAADVMFDKKQMMEENLIQFLKNTKLSEISFENTENASKFIIRKNDGTFIEASNRPISNNELRGQPLRAMLDAAKNSNPEQSLYDAIDQSVRTLDYSHIIAKLKFAFTQTSIYENGELMTEEHFQLFTAVLWHIIQNKIELGQLKGITNSMIKELSNEGEVLQAWIWRDVDLEKIYEATRTSDPNVSPSQIAAQYTDPSFDLNQSGYFLPSHGDAFEENLDQISRKANDLEQRGYSEEAVLARALVKNLNLEAMKFEAGVYGFDQFHARCEQLIIQAQKSDLGNFRGFPAAFHNILNFLKGAANYFLEKLSLSPVEQKATETIHTVHQMKGTLDLMRQEHEKNKEEEDHDNENRGSWEMN